MTAEHYRSVGSGYKGGGFIKSGETGSVARERGNGKRVAASRACNRQETSCAAERQDNQ